MPGSTSGTMASFKSSRQRKVGTSPQLPSHVQTNINKEERLLQRNLAELDKETRQRMRCIVQGQKVAGTKLKSLEARLLASQEKFHALIHSSEDEPEAESPDPSASASRRDTDMDIFYDGKRRVSGYLVYQDRLVVSSKEKQALRSSLRKLQAKQEAAVKEAAGKEAAGKDRKRSVTFR